ncbi:MAG: DivIVA domain-containing protein [Bacilli bacterium]|nr:DivIVA domain-containing protein [Bacilli bacterium]
MKRFSIVNNGYNIEEVNEFIDLVIKRLEQLSADNSNYLIQLDELRRQVEIEKNKDKETNNNDTENKVTKALIAAQETTDKMKELAKEEADLILREAKENANAIIHEALIDAEKKEQEYELLKKDYNVYKTKIETLVKAQLELLESNKEDK